MTDQERFTASRFVTKRIFQLVGNDPANLLPASRAQLAQLRQAVNREPGTVPSIWPITSEGIPDDIPNLLLERTETAIHIALTQFAVHQQARPRLMHDSSQPFGRAVRHLAGKVVAMSPETEAYDSPVYRRFTTLSTTTNLPGIRIHLGSLITQLRSHEIPFDYGRFTYDFLLLQDPGQNAEVRRRWGRDFHHFQTKNTADSTTVEGEN